MPEEFFAWTFPTGVVVHRFTYTVIKLWEIPVEVLKRTGLIGIFPLMVLGKDGKRPAVMEELITTLEAVEENKGKELLSLTYIIASLVFESPTERGWLKRRFKVLQDALRGTWAYQEIMQEGWEEGMQKGIVEGRAEERLQRVKDQRQLLVTLVLAHFPNLAELAQQQANAVEDPEVLQRVVLKLVAAQTQEQAEQVLLTAGQRSTRKAPSGKQRKKRSV